MCRIWYNMVAPEKPSKASNACQYSRLKRACGLESSVQVRSLLCIVMSLPPGLVAAAHGARVVFILAFSRTPQAFFDRLASDPELITCTQELIRAGCSTSVGGGAHLFLAPEDHGDVVDHLVHHGVLLFGLGNAPTFLDELRRNHVVARLDFIDVVMAALLTRPVARTVGNRRRNDVRRVHRRVGIIILD